MNMKFTFEVDGREVTLSEDELKAFARAKLSAQATVKKCKAPIVGQAFAVNPMAIDRSLFSEERKDERQERTRQFILEAFTEVDANPKRYAKPFWTMIMKKTWDGSKTRKELVEMADAVGHLANWVEQVLEWAQRISNGETWEGLCNEADRTAWYRLVRWEHDLRLIGGCAYLYTTYSATNIGDGGGSFYDGCNHSVPLVSFRQ